ncbi:MAG: hypothetical protein U1F23_08075 [Lysobacterales bacterium]
MAMLIPMPGWDDDEYQFRGPVREITEVADILGEPAWRLIVTVMRFGDEDANLAILVTRRAWPRPIPAGRRHGHRRRAMAARPAVGAVERACCARPERERNAARIAAARFGSKDRRRWAASLETTGTGKVGVETAKDPEPTADVGEIRSRRAPNGNVIFAAANSALRPVRESLDTETPLPPMCWNTTVLHERASVLMDDLGMPPCTSRT